MITYGRKVSFQAAGFSFSVFTTHNFEFRLCFNIYCVTTMNFTAAQTTAFFENGPQMNLPQAVRARLALEGLDTVTDFVDFKEDQLNDAFKNMRTAIPGVPVIPAVLGQNNVVQVATVAAIAPIPPTLVSAKCALRLKVASVAFHYYQSIGRTITSVNMNYTNVLKDFYVEYESIESLSDATKPDVPLLHKNNTPLRWIESFKDCLFRTFGVRKTPLLYVVRDTVKVPPEADDPLANNKAFGSSGSILDELIARLDHDHPLYKSDNAMVYSMLEETTRGTVYAPTIKPYGRRKDGRAAWLSMISSHAGNDKWEQLQKEKSKFLMNTKWNGRAFSLEKFTGMHRSAYVNLEEASDHVNFQLPTEHTRVGYLIDNIQNPDPDLRAAIANVRLDTNGMRSNFEDTVAFLLPVDPYSKHRRSQDNKHHANVSDTSALKGKHQSKTGVDFRWYKPDEYKELTKEQRSELYEWQHSKEGQKATNKQKRDGGHKPKMSTTKKLKLKVATLEAKLKESDKNFTYDDIEACIESASTPSNKTTSFAAGTKPPAKSTPSPAPPTYTRAAAAVALKNLLKRKRDDST